MRQSLLSIIAVFFIVFSPSSRAIECDFGTPEECLGPVVVIGNNNGSGGGGPVGGPGWGGATPPWQLQAWCSANLETCMVNDPTTYCQVVPGNCVNGSPVGNNSDACTGQNPDADCDRRFQIGCGPDDEFPQATACFAACGYGSAGSFCSVDLYNSQGQQSGDTLVCVSNGTLSQAAWQKVTCG